MEQRAQDRLTLRFRDPALERDCLQALAREAQPIWRALMPATLALWLLAGLVDEQLGGSPANGTRLTVMRFAAAPFVVGCIALAYASRERFERTWLWSFSLMGGVLLGTVVVMQAFPASRDVFDGKMNTAGQLLLVLGGYTMFAVRWLFALVPCVLLSAVHLAVAAALYPDDLRVTVMWLFIGNAIGALAAYMLEQARRRAFLANRLLDEERARNEELLHNMVPRSIAARLKTNGERIADAHDDVTILFADIVGFSPLAERIAPADLVTTLDELFSKFDEHTDRLGLEKIKTVGDAYMVVGGAPRTRPDHPAAIADLGAAMLDVVDGHVCPDGTTLSLRIGIHTGPAVGGVIGKRKLVYDLWGDSVNVASRMESHGVTGRIHVSERTASRLRETHELEDRGPVRIKGKGEMRTYLIVGRKPSSADRPS